MRGMAWVAVLASFGVACGAQSDRVESTSVTVLTDVSESSYLADVLGGPASRALLLPTDAGLLVVGGLEIGESDELASVFDEAAVVHEDGSVAVPAPVPGGPVANLAGSAGDGRAYVAGTRCNSGTMGADDGSLACEPGEPVLLHLDLATLTWTELSLPAEAPAPAGFLGDQQVYALADDTLVYTVEAADGGAAEGWVSTDGGREWERIAEAPGWSCAAQGRLLAIDDRTERPAAPEEGESEATITSDEVDATLHLAVSIYDPAANRWGEPDDDAPQLSVVAGATSISCAPEQGVVAFVLTGGRAGAIIGYSPDGPDGGWSTREDPRGSRFMELLRSTDGLLLPQMGTEDLVRLEGGLGAEAETVPLPEGSTPIAGIGRSVLVVDGGVPRLEK